MLQKTYSTVIIIILSTLLVIPGFLALTPRGQTATAASTATSVTIYASADTYVDAGDPTQNFGSSTTIDVGACWEFTTAQIGMISFNLSTIPANAIIHSAELRLYRLTGGSSLTARVGVHRVTGPWQENTVTWNTRPGYVSTPIDTVDIGGTSNVFYTWDVTSLVQQWVNGSVPNYGIAVTLEPNVNVRCRRFASREQAAAYRPRLVVSYTPTTPTPVPGMRSLRLDGDGDYVEVPFADDLNTFNAITIEAWVKRDAYRCETVVGNGWRNSYWLGFCTGPIRFYHTGYTRVDGNAAIPPGQWTHIAVTYDGTTRRYYVNGQLDKKTTENNGPITGNPLQVFLGIGGDYDGGYYFKGLIDEVRIWNVVRTQSQIQTNMYEVIDGPKPGLVAVWHFDGDTRDASGNHDGLLRGDAWFSPEGFPSAPTPTPTPPPPTPTPTPTPALGSISGIIWEDANYNGTPDPGESGIANVRLELRKGSLVIGSQTSGSDGRYRFDNLAAGTYVVDVDDTSVPWYYSWNTGNDPETVVLGVGEHRDNVNFGYARPPTPTPTPTPTITPPDFIAMGLEVTQGIQDRNNSVPLVAGKRTYVRFYVGNSVWGARTISTVSAALQLRRADGLTINLRPVRPASDRLTPLPPHLVYVNREFHRAAFLFEIPSAFLNGTVTIIGVVNPGRRVLETRYDNNRSEVTVTFQPVPPLNLHVIRVRYRMRWEDSGVQGVVSPPDMMHVNKLAEWLRAAYPISQLNLKLSTFTWPRLVTARKVDTDGDGAPDTVEHSLRASDVNGLVESAFAPVDEGIGAGTPMYRYAMVWDGVGDGDGLGVFMRGRCCSGRTSSGPTGGGTWGWDSDGSYGDWYGAHELGHALGRPHAPYCGAEGDPDDYPYPYGNISPFPAYMSYIGSVEAPSYPAFGFHIFDQTIFTPGPRWDFYSENGRVHWNDVMTYCSRQWVGKYTYEQLMERIQREGRIIAARERSASQNMLSLTGTIDPRTNTVQMEPMFVIPDAVPSHTRQPGDYAIVLRSADGWELARYPFTPEPTQPGPPAPGALAEDRTRLAFSEMVPYIPGTDRVDIEGPGGTVLKTVRAGSSTPRVTITAPSPNTPFSGDTLRVAWTASDPDGDPVYALVQYSADDGRTWRAVAFVTTDNFVDVPAANVSVSSQGHFRVLVSDGIHTSVAQVGPVVVPNRPPDVQILSPTNGATFLSAQTIPLRAFIYDPDLGTLSGEHVTWYSDKDGLLGYGDTLSITGLSVGPHVITLKADDGDGGVTKQTVNITIVAEPSDLPPVEDALEVFPRQIVLDVARGETSAALFIDNANVSQSLTWQATTSASWLRLDIFSGTTPQQVRLSVDLAALSIGTHRAQVTITSPTTKESVTVDVVVRVTTPTYLPMIFR